jgi:hypothetical protein
MESIYYYNSIDGIRVYVTFSEETAKGFTSESGTYTKGLILFGRPVAYLVSQTYVNWSAMPSINVGNFLSNFTL